MRVLVVDDESMARRRMLRLLGEIETVSWSESCDSAAAALAMLAREPVDVLLLDIQMPGLSGLDTLAALEGHGPTVIFVTAHPDHALKAFELGARDYLLKPVDTERLRVALDRVPTPAEPPQVQLEALAIPTRKGVELLPPASIHLAMLQGASLVLHTERGTFYSELSLADLQRRLPTFLRASRQALINPDQILRFEDVDSGGYIAHLRNGTTVAVSRSVARKLRRQFSR